MVADGLLPWFSALDLEGSSEPVRNVSDCGFHNLVVLVCNDNSISTKGSGGEADVGGYS